MGLKGWFKREKKYLQKVSAGYEKAQRKKEMKDYDKMLKELREKRELKTLTQARADTKKQLSDVKREIKEAKKSLSRYKYTKAKAMGRLTKKGLTGVAKEAGKHVHIELDAEDLAIAELLQEKEGKDLKEEQEELQ